MICSVTCGGWPDSWYRVRARTVALPAGLPTAAVAVTVTLVACAATRADDGRMRRAEELRSKTTAPFGAGAARSSFTVTLTVFPAFTEAAAVVTAVTAVTDGRRLAFGLPGAVLPGS